MRRIILLLLLIAGLSTALPVRASFAPDCDKTVYNVKSKLTTEPLPGGTVGPTIIAYQLSIEDLDKQFPADKRGQYIIEVTTNRICGINDFAQLFVNLANWGLSILAVLALLLYIWGGFTFIIAGGRSEYIENAKNIMIGTSTGIIVVLTAYLMITFYSLASLGSTQAFEAIKTPDWTRSVFGETLSCSNTYSEDCNVVSGTDQSKTFHLGCGDRKNKFILTIQQNLTKYECLPKSAQTGCFDQATTEAVIKFQTAGCIDVADPGAACNRTKINSTIPKDGSAYTSIKIGQVDYYTRNALAGNDSYTKCP